MARTVAFLTPESAHFSTSNFPGLSVVNSRPVLAYDQSTQETCYWTVACPQAFTAPFTTIIHMFGNAASTNATYWEVAVEAVTPGDATDLDSTTSFDTVNTGNVGMPATQGYQTSLSVACTNGDSAAAGDYVRISVARDADNGSDNFAADAYVTLVELRDATT